MGTLISACVFLNVVIHQVVLQNELGRHVNMVVVLVGVHKHGEAVFVANVVRIRH